MIKLNNNGIPIWNKTYDNGGIDNFNSIIQTIDGGFALVGRTDPVGVSIDQDIWLVKTDSTGELEWQARIPDEQEKASGIGLLETTEGDFVIVAIKKHLIYLEMEFSLVRLLV